MCLKCSFSISGVHSWCSYIAPRNRSSSLAPFFHTPTSRNDASIPPPTASRAITTYHSTTKRVTVSLPDSDAPFASETSASSSRMQQSTVERPAFKPAHVRQKHVCLASAVTAGRTTSAIHCSCRVGVALRLRNSGAAHRGCWTHAGVWGNVNVAQRMCKGWVRRLLLARKCGDNAETYAGRDVAKLQVAVASTCPCALLLAIGVAEKALCCESRNGAYRTDIHSYAIHMKT